MAMAITPVMTAFRLFSFIHRISSSDSPGIEASRRGYNHVSARPDAMLEIQAAECVAPHDHDTTFSQYAITARLTVRSNHVSRAPLEWCLSAMCSD